MCKGVKIGNDGYFWIIKNNKTIKIRVNECVIYIYHSFNARWYNQNFPIKLLYNIQKNKNKLYQSKRKMRQNKWLKENNILLLVEKN